MESASLLAEARPERGSRHSRKLRKAGRIPAIVYGHKETPEAVSVTAESIDSAIKHHSRTFMLELAGGSQQVMLKQLQWDHLGSTVVHVDFQRVSADERVEVHIPFEFRGDAPGILTGGVFEHPMQWLNVECAALSQPESIRVEIGGLNLGEAIYVKDLKLPDGVVALDPPDFVVARVVQAAGEAPEDAQIGGPVEPEKIGAKDEDEEK